MNKTRTKNLQTTIVEMDDYVWVESIQALLKHDSSGKFVEVEFEEKEAVLKMMGVKGH